MRAVQRVLLATSTAPGVATAISASSASAANTEALTTILTTSAPSSLPPLFTTSDSSSESQAPTITPAIASKSDNNTNNDNSSKSTLATKLGLGLGIPLLVLLVVGIAVYVHRRQNKLQRGRSSTEAPPFNFDAPEVAPISAADLAFRQQQQKQKHQQQQGKPEREQQSHGPPRSNSLWRPEWSPTAGGGGGGPYDDNQVGFVGPLGFQGYYQGYRVPLDGEDQGGDLGSPSSYQDRDPYLVTVHEDGDGMAEINTLHDSPGHLSQIPIVQVPVVQVRRPEQVAPEHQRRSVWVRISGGFNNGFDEVSPLSESGSGPPYPRVSAISVFGSSRRKKQYGDPMKGV